MQPTRTPLSEGAKYTADRPFADSEKAAPTPIELADAVEPDRDQRALMMVQNPRLQKIP
jgi:hypothetical protein